MSGFGHGGDGVPFAAGEIYGARSWSVDNQGNLRAVSYSSLWENGENEARCAYSHAHKKGQHQTAGMQCTCGFYAYFDEPQTAAWVEGVIKGYGRVTIGTLGFRCEKARIVALCLPGDTKTPIWNFRGWLAQRENTEWAFGWGLAAFVAGVCAFIIGIPTVVELSWWWTPLPVLGLLSALLGATTCVTVDNLPPDNNLLTEEQVRMIRAKYRDAAVYHSRAKMLKAYPLKDPDQWLNQPR